VANPDLPAEGIVQMGKEYACHRMPKIAGNLIAVLCQHPLPAIAPAKGFAGKLFATFCQIVQE